MMQDIQSYLSMIINNNTISLLLNIYSLDSLFSRKFFRSLLWCVCLTANNGAGCTCEIRWFVVFFIVNIFRFGMVSLHFGMFVLEKNGWVNENFNYEYLLALINPPK